MALVLTEDEVLLVDSARALFGREAPVSAFRALRDSGDALCYDPGLLKQLADNGFVVPHVAEDDGGLGLGASAAGLIAEQSGRVLAATTLLSAAMAATLITRAASKAQKSELLPPLIAGERVIVPALDETARHDPNVLATIAERSGDDWLLTGGKTAVIDGVGAHAFLISAMSDGESAVFLVEADAAGLQVDKFVAVDSRNYARLSLSGTPAQRLDHGGASGALAAARDLGRALLAAELLGICDEAFNRTVTYLKERQQFGRPIGSFQALQHRSARLYARLDLARGVVLAALRAIDESDDAKDSEATWLASLSKAVMTKLSRDLLVEAMQMHGGIGVTDAFDIGLFVKRGRVAGELLGDDYFHTERLARDRWKI